MKNIFHVITKNFSNLLLALALSIAVWISAVTAADPTVEKIYPRTVSIDFVGKDPSLVMLSNSASQMSITMSAPQSIWDSLTRETGMVRALVDLSELGPGIHDVPVQIQVGVNPVRVVSYTPVLITIELDAIVTKVLPIRLIIKGEPDIGYLAGSPTLGETAATISGPSSLVEQVEEVRAMLDIEGISETVDRSVSLNVVDINGDSVDNITMNPPQVRVTQPITQRGGYRNVVVKVITSGQIASGYRVTNISVFPPAVTVFSDDPGLIEGIPGYVETMPLDLTGAKDDLDTFLNLNLPPGVSVVEDSSVEVQVGIAAIEGSITLGNMEVTATGLTPGLSVEISPQSVDVILSGPLPVLDNLKTSDIRIIINLEGLTEGVYQRIPQVEVSLDDIRVQSILPGSIEVRISNAPTVSPTSTRDLGESSQTTLTPMPSVTPTIP